MSTCTRHRVIHDMLNLLSPLMLLLSFVHLNSGHASSNCSLVMDIKPGEQGFIFNTDFPHKYWPGSQCELLVYSDRPMALSCDPFELPFSTDCELASLTTYDGDDTRGARHCGDRSINLITKSNKLVIRLTTPPFLPPGKFFCTLEAVESLDDPTGCKCGRKNDNSVRGTEDAELEPRIVGGEETGIGEFPMMAGLFDLSRNQLFCGATIINKRQVITAAHCLNEISVTDIKVLVGEHDLSTANSTKLSPIESYTVHPRYNTTTQDYDIAVITIVNEMTFNQRVGPVCLPFQAIRNTFDGNFVTILGWGSTEFAGGPSNTLRKAQLNVTNSKICSKTYKDLSTRQLCTFGSGRDSCQFDSGGPVLWQNPKTGRIVAVGIISLGSVCGEAEPAVNTRVGAFMDWLMWQTPPGISYCTRE